MEGGESVPGATADLVNDREHNGSGSVVWTLTGQEQRYGKTKLDHCSVSGGRKVCVLEFKDISSTKVFLL